MHPVEVMKDPRGQKMLVYIWHPNRGLGNVMGWSYNKNLENSWAIRYLITWDL
jgi:hypothetical protein